ncbi:HsdM family class I SAM-dependent methyltransferase [Methylosoma difficile]
MRLYSSSKTSDSLGRYYTKPAVGKLLVNSMEIESPAIIMDICVGDGALVREAAKLWEKSSFITVDIEENGKDILFQTLSGRKVTHYVTDSLDFNLAKSLGVQWGQADIALCNPPYIRPKWKNQFMDILEDAGLNHVLPKMREIPADLLFIAQNLRLLRQGGRLGLILPDGIIAGEKFSVFRKTLLMKYQVESVIELPRRIFKNTDAKAHILILSKQCNTSELISIQRLEKDGRLSPKFDIEVDIAVKRLDYSYFSQYKKNKNNNKRKINDVVIEVFRGGYSSIDRKSTTFPVFHTSDFSIDSAFVPQKYQLSPDKVKCVIGKFAIAGDILVGRIGRNLSQKVCMVHSGNVAISDCILLLRVLPEYRQAVFTYLKSESGRLALEAGTHGVGAKFLTVKSLIEIEF